MVGQKTGHLVVQIDARKYMEPGQIFKGGQKKTRQIPRYKIHRANPTHFYKNESGLSSVEAAAAAAATEA